MPRPHIISQEYITPASVTNACLFDGRSRTELAYSDLLLKPLSSRRRCFIGTNVCFVVLHLCAVLTLVIYTTARRQTQRSHSSANHECELCDLWCTWNCSQLTRNGDERLMTQMVININETHSGKEKGGRCCVKGRDALSTNYGYFLRSKSTYADKDSPSKKIFDGIRLKDNKWLEDNDFPRHPHSVLSFDKKKRSFVITASGTFSVHSRIDFDFSCLNNKKLIRQQLIIDSRTSNTSELNDERAQLGQNNSTRNGTVVYTSSINVLVELQKGDSLKIITDPMCATPRTLVVFQSKHA